MREDEIRVLLNDKQKGRPKIIDNVHKELVKQINDPFFYVSYDPLVGTVYLSMNMSKYEHLLYGNEHYDLTRYGLVFDRYGWNSHTDELYLFYKWDD